MLIPSCTVRLEGAWNAWKCVSRARAGFRENRLIVGVWHGGHSVRAKPPHDRVCVSVNRRGGSAPFTDGPHRRTGSGAGQAGRHVFRVQMPQQLERAAVRYSFGGRTFAGTRGEEVTEILWDVYRADVRGFAVDIWAFMRTVKANVITVERVFGEPRCVCVVFSPTTFLDFINAFLWWMCKHCQKSEYI